MQKKIFITYVVLILIAVFVTGALSLSLLNINYINLIEDRLVTNANLIEEFIYSDYGKSELNKLAQVYSDKIDARVTFINNTGWVVGDSDVDIENLENHLDRPEIQIALKGKVGVNKRYSSTLDEDLFYVAIPFKKQGFDLSVIRLSVPLRDITYWNKILFKYIIISIVTGLLVALILGYRFVRSFTEPIRDLTNATKKIARGNYGEKVYVLNDNELGVLADNFNAMSEKLHNTISEIEDRNSKTEAILTSMLNGVIALDNSKKVIFVNPAIEEVFGIKEEDVKGKHILEMVRNNILVEEIKSLINNSISTKTEIEINEPKHKIFNVYSSAIMLNQDIKRKIGVVLIFQDITEIRKLETMRKGFVANVSHELKTPLTSIRGFIETLKNGAIEDENLREKFLDIIDIEAGRLFALIQDILVLSEIENNQTVTKEIINVNMALSNVIDIMCGIAKKKDIKMINNINKNLSNITGKRSWFKQMLINLIDNAIKYSQSGGEVTISAYEEKNKLILNVKDTGMGIGEGHLDRLFERFYRVEKARSKQIEGTGLGLAIVKHIVISFDGEIHVNSEINKGSEFIIILPIK